MSWLGDDRALGKADYSHRMSISIHLMIKTLPLLRSSMSIHPRIQISSGFVFCPFREASPQTSSPNFLISNFPIEFFPVLTIQSNHWPQPICQYLIACLATSPSKQRDQPGVLLRVPPTSKIPLYHCPSERFPVKGLECCSCPLWGGTRILCRTFCGPGLSLVSWWQEP